MASHFVVSLDFEQAWGMEASKAYGRERASLVGARAAIPAILDLAARYSVRCTWATVGLLFFDDREELLAHLPALRPAYADPDLSPYDRLDKIGRNEKEDGLHFGRSLIKLIRDCPGQEVASHTFSHYYGLQDGGDADAFRADLDAARRAAKTMGIELKSIVFPRNQVRDSYLPLCHEAGYLSYRGNRPSFLHEARPRSAEHAWMRLLRGAEAYLPRPALSQASHARLNGEMVDVPASRFLRPASPWSMLDRLQLRLILAEMTQAAKGGGDYHLWWHPQNFGCRTNSNLHTLTSIFEHYSQMADLFGMKSKTMLSISEEMTCSSAGFAN